MEKIITKVMEGKILNSYMEEIKDGKNNKLQEEQDILEVILPLDTLKGGYEVVCIYENLWPLPPRESMKRVERLTGKTITFYEGDHAER